MGEGKLREGFLGTNKSKVEKNVMLVWIEIRERIRVSSLYLFELVKEWKEINYIKSIFVK